MTKKMMRATAKMLKSSFSRAWGRGKATRVLIVVAALTLIMATPALAATGGNFLLGVANTATAITQLTANIANPAMKLVNTSTSTGATALNLQTASSKPPMTVNSATKVTNLNADAVDGKDSRALGVTIKTSHEPYVAERCDTPKVGNECAPVTVKVPTGKQYRVTVLSSVSVRSEYDPAYGNESRTEVSFCPAIKGGAYTTQSCLAGWNGSDQIDPRVHGEGAASSAEVGPLPAGTYYFSTAINPHQELGGGKAHTTVLVTDASAPGPPIE